MEPTTVLLLVLAGIAFFFILSIILGSFFMLNLVLGVLSGLVCFPPRWSLN